MKEIRFTVLLNEKESQMLDKLTYELKFGDNRSACVRYLITSVFNITRPVRSFNLKDGYQKHIEQSQKKASGK